MYTGFKRQIQPNTSESDKKEILSEKEKALNNSVEALKKDIKEMRALYFGAQSLGVTPKELKSIVKKNKLPLAIMKLVYTETPLNKLKMPHWDSKIQQEKDISIDEYLRNYLMK